MRLLDDAIGGLPAGGVIPGDTVFKLYDTYGFPEDLTADIARERGLSTDRDGFERQMDAQRERARKASRFAAVCGRGRADVRAADRVPRLRDAASARGRLSRCSTPTVKPVQALAAGESGTVVLERTPFYAESGGQVGGHGHAHEQMRRGFVVRDTQKLGSSFRSQRHPRGRQPRDRRSRCKRAVDAERRAAIVLNHSATHLLHAALRVGARRARPAKRLARRAR